MLRSILASAALIGAFVVVMILLGRLTTTQEQQQMRDFFEAREAFRPDTFQLLGLLGSSLRESSGLAVSRQYDGVIWTHNDSGDGPILHALRMDATPVRRFRLAAIANDWEAVATGPCPHLQEVEHCLYVGDIGNNDRLRETVQIYILPEPDPFSEEADELRVATLHIHYTEGPDDTEALAVSPEGLMTLVTKGRNGALLVYHVPPEEWTERLDTDVLDLTAAGELPFGPEPVLGRAVTGAAYSPSGALLAVRSYTEIFFFTVGEGGALRTAREACFLARSEPQGEGIDFLDERVLLTSSEGARGESAALYRVVCP